MYLRSNKRKCFLVLFSVLGLGALILAGVVVLRAMLNLKVDYLAFALDFLGMGLVAIGTIGLCAQSPQAKVDRLLEKVLKEAGKRDAKSVTFVLNDSDQSLYVDIDEWVVVSPCTYKLTPQLGSLIKARHNVTPYRLDDGLSYAYFLTPTSAK